MVPGGCQSEFSNIRKQYCNDNGTMLLPTWNCWHQIATTPGGRLYSKASDEDHHKDDQNWSGNFPTRPSLQNCICSPILFSYKSHRLICAIMYINTHIYIKQQAYV